MGEEDSGGSVEVQKARDDDGREEDQERLDTVVGQ